MALTRHEKLHLDAMNTEIADNKLRPDNTKTRLALAKGVTLANYDKYQDDVKVEVDKILASGNFPNLDKPCDIHDYLEKTK